MKINYRLKLFIFLYLSFELSFANVSTKTIDSSNFIPLSSFFYADNPRHTITGDIPLKETKLKLLPSLVFAGTYTGIFIAQHIGQLNTIWDTLSPTFKFQEDITQDLWADKCGHFYGAYLTSYVLSESLLEIGMSWESATCWGGVLGLAYSSYVEVLDGFGPKWGFSPSDFYADLIGAGYYVAQHYFPLLQNFTPKFMYFPADLHGERQRLPHDAFIDDYSSQTFWMTVNVYNLLPVKLKKYWFPWLQISFGYAARNLFAYQEFPDEQKEYEYITDVKTKDVWGSPRYIIAFDYDLYKILPDGGSFWMWLKQSLQYFKLPSPAIEFSNSRTKFYLIYPFSL